MTRVPETTPVTLTLPLGMVRLLMLGVFDQAKIALSIAREAKLYPDNPLAVEAAEHHARVFDYAGATLTLLAQQGNKVEPDFAESFNGYASSSLANAETLAYFQARDQQGAYTESGIAQIVQSDEDQVKATTEAYEAAIAAAQAQTEPSSNSEASDVGELPQDATPSPVVDREQPTDAPDAPEQPAD